MTLTLHSFPALVAAVAALSVSVLIWGMFLDNLMEILPGNENVLCFPYFTFKGQAKICLFFLYRVTTF